MPVDRPPSVITLTSVCRVIPPPHPARVGGYEARPTVRIRLWSVKSYGEFGFWFASIKVAAIIAFILIAGGRLGGA